MADARNHPQSEHGGELHQQITQEPWKLGLVRVKIWRSDENECFRKKDILGKLGGKNKQKPLHWILRKCGEITNKMYTIFYWRWLCREIAWLSQQELMNLWTSWLVYWILTVRLWLTCCLTSSQVWYLPILHNLEKRGWWWLCCLYVYVHLKWIELLFLVVISIILYNSSCIFISFSK